MSKSVKHFFLFTDKTCQIYAHILQNRICFCNPAMGYTPGVVPGVGVGHSKEGDRAYFNLTPSDKNPRSLVL